MKGAETSDHEYLHLYIKGLDLWNKHGSQPLPEIVKESLVPERDACGFGE